MWLFLAFTCALCNASLNIFSKKIADRASSSTLALGMRFFVALFMTPLVILNFNSIHLSPNILLLLLIATIIMTISTTLTYKAYQKDDVSLLYPLMSFTPVFLIFTGYFILGEKISVQGIFATFLVFLGSYILYIKKGSIFAPLKHLFSNSAPLLILTVSFLYSISSANDKLGVLASSPFFWVFACNLSSSFLLLLFTLPKLRKEKLKINFDKILLPVAIIGLLETIALVTQMTAINLSPVTYVIGIKRLSAVIVVFLAALLLKEKITTSRVLGSLIMIAGAILIYLAR